MSDTDSNGCEGSGPHDNGERRVLWLGSLKSKTCQACFNHCMSLRRSLNAEALANDPYCLLPCAVPHWQDLEVCGE